MSWISFCDRLEELPLILAGPNLQQTSSESVTVWVAFKESCRVTLQVYETANNGKDIARLVLVGEQTTVALGQSLHVVAVTAQFSSGNRLHCGQIYAYDLSLQPCHSSSNCQTLAQALTSPSFPLVPISYFSHQLPTFSLPPEDLNRVRLVHGSCRKLHGKGYDTLPILDSLIEKDAALPDNRPHQVFLTGDQIYGDDVADPLLWALTEVGDRLLGWEEKLPLLPSTTNATHLTPKQMKPGQRSQIACQQAGLTAGIRHKAEYAKSHLFGLGEYYAIYLFTWSQVFWSQPFPKGREICEDKKTAKRWDEELKDLQQFASTVWKVRRALANIPTYTIFDDHDVSDDWNLNEAWCLRVLGKPLGRRVVRNALLAYAIFQGWGNTPEQFQEGQSGAKLLKAARDWSVSAGEDEKAGEAIARYLGLPESDPSTGLPKMRLDRDVWILDRSPEALTWHYTIRQANYEVIVLDTRTWRGYPKHGNAISPPMLLCPSAFERQLRSPLQETDKSKIEATLVIAPTNIFSLKAIDWIQKWQLKQGKVFNSDVGDGWNINHAAKAELLATLFEKRDRIIVLSGDIHYSAAIRLDYWSHLTNKSHLLIQLTTSALKNSELMTQLIHTKLKSFLFPERKRYWIGSIDPPDEKEVKKLEDEDRSLSDWECRLQWIHRQPLQLPQWGKNLSWLKEQKRSTLWHWLLNLVQWLWQNRWFQDGKEVVGLNNLGYIQFIWSDNPSDRAVIQDNYWYTSWGRPRIALSRFKVLFKEIGD
ncbi:PhoD-like phosphatase [Candidatus Gracilibacteria bacterium]|nr:PhoD-like phosphatase [Candidatus Gracilibacteria bacterium]